MSTAQANGQAVPTFEDMCERWHASVENLRTFNRVLTTDAKIAQTPKKQVWALNKAKLYRYARPADVEQQHRTPLLLVFAIMNRPHVLGPPAGAQLRGST